jgi:MPBQ/MSBQ methyltransferase
MHTFKQISSAAFSSPLSERRRAATAHAATTPVEALSAFASNHAAALGWAAAAIVVLVAIKTLLDQGSRKYDGNVGDEYDAWTREGILEHYWGEHIHLGYYTAEERQPGFFAWGKKDFKQVRPLVCSWER